MNNRKIVFLDKKTIGEDVDYSGFEELGDVTSYDVTTEEECVERIEDAEVIVVNKLRVNEQTIGKAKNLKLVCVTATGTDNLDKEYLAKRSIEWRNVAGYSTNSVAQHTFTLLLALLEKLPYYDNYVKSGTYAKDDSFSHFSNVFHEFAGMTMGIIGMGAIGRKVAEIATAFGAKVVYYSSNGENRSDRYERVDLDTLLKISDVVSIHSPLTEKTRGLINKEALNKMKPSAILINVGRGPIVVEEDLVEALKEGTIAAAGLDVLCKEPMMAGHPFLELQDSNKLIITPHIAWASKEARQRVLDMVCDHIRNF